MSDLLKEAIADAKAVRETALANAKMALEEAFTPQLQSMLSAKLREDDDEDIYGQDEIPGDEEEEIPMDIPVDDEEEIPMDAPVEDGEDAAMYAQDEIPGEDEEIPMDIPVDDEEGIPGEEEMEGVIEINGVKYAPILPEFAQQMQHEDFAGQDSAPEDDPDQPAGDGEEMGETLDLESIIKELEAELNEEDDAYPENVEGDVNSEQPSEKMGNTSSPSAVTEDEYTASEKNVEDDEDPEHVGDDSTGVGNTPAMSGVSEDTVYEIDGSMFEQEDEDEEVEENIHAELKEYKEAVRFLKDKLHEVNILNAKLLFTNKLFKEFVLDNDQKLRVVETFDRAQSTREIKLVYTTLAENFKDTKIGRKSKIKESASVKAGSTKPSKQSRKVITEEAKVANRFRKLAGII